MGASKFGMERLIHSKAIPSKPHCNLKPSSHPLVPRFAGVVSARKMAFSSASFRWVPLPEPLRVKSLSCSLQDPSLASPETREELSFTEDSTEGLACKLNLRRLVPLIYSPQRKVVDAGAVILLSAILLTLLHPVVVSPAFASFPNAAKTGPAAVAAGTSLLRIELLSSAWTGFLAGCLHTLSGPDHLAALAPLSIGCSRMESAAVGALWGCGHDAGQLIFGLLFLLLKDRLHIEVLRTWGTRVVGFTLLVIGAMGIRESSEVPAPCVVLENGECDVSGYETMANPSVGKKKIGFTTFATGIVHGLQPDALMMILPALALPSRLAGAAFLFMFLVGTVFAMGSYTMFIGSCSQVLKERIPRVTEKLTWASSLVAIGLGVAILISEFFGLSLY